MPTSAGFFFKIRPRADDALKLARVGDYAQQYRQGNGGLRTAPEGIVAAARTTAAQISDVRKPPPTFFVGRIFILPKTRSVFDSIAAAVMISRTAAAWRRAIVGCGSVAAA